MPACLVIEVCLDFIGIIDQIRVVNAHAHGETDFPRRGIIIGQSFVWLRSWRAVDREIAFVNVQKDGTWMDKRPRALALTYIT